MVRVLVISLSVGAMLALSACNLANQSFSCGPSVGYDRVDRDLYTRPATIGPSGYAHC